MVATLPAPASEVPETGRATTPPEPSDEELCRLAAAGREAAGEMVIRHERIIWALINRMELCSSVDPDELHQAGLLALENAVYHFKPDRGNKFCTYAWWAINNAVRRKAGQETSKFASLNKRCVDEDAGQILDFIPAPETSPVVEEMRARVAKLPPVMQRVVKMRYGFDGEPAKWPTIAKALGLSVEQCKTVTEKAFELLREQAA